MIKEGETVSKKPGKKKRSKKSSPIADKVAKADKLDLSHLNNSFIHVKVGDANRPANEDDINEIEIQLTELFKEHNIDCLLYVTHQAVEIKIVSSKK